MTNLALPRPGSLEDMTAWLADRVARERPATGLAPDADATPLLSPATRDLYVAARAAASGPPAGDAPLPKNDLDGFIQPMVEGVLRGMETGSIHAPLAATRGRLVTRRG